MSQMNETNPNGFVLNNDQWSFIFSHYPEYAQAPYDMMSWLFGQAMEKEEADRAVREPDDIEVIPGGKKPRQIGMNQKQMNK